MKGMVLIPFIGLLMLGCGGQGNIEMRMKNIDWKALQFICSVEQNPPLDPEADEWFEQARKLERLDDERYDAEVIRLYEKAAAKGHYKAINNLSKLYVDGRGVPQDDVKSVELLEQLIDANVPLGYYNMGSHLQQGIGVKQDRAAAMAYFRRAADLGNREGMWAIGDELLTVFAREPEPNKSRGEAIGVQMLECSLGKGLAEAGHTLGMHFVEEDVGRALPYFQAAAALGHRQSLYMLYSAFDEGEFGLAKDTRRAACYNRMRSEQDEEPGKKFPDIDQRCPLPPPPAAELQSGQPAPRIGLWGGRDDDGLFFRVIERGQIMPTFRQQSVSWKWLAVEPQGTRMRTGEPCPWPGSWACEDLPSGAVLMIHGQYFPQVDGCDVTWRLLKAS